MNLSWPWPWPSVCTKSLAFVPRDLIGMSWLGMPKLEKLSC